MPKNSYLCTPNDNPVFTQPPPGWEDAVVPSGTVFPEYRREQWIKSKYGKFYLWWYRACYWLPRQTINVEFLTQDNEWAVVESFEGPSMYRAINSLDGSPSIFRLVAA